MIIHRPKLRWSPKLGHIMHRRICPWIRDRLHRWREAVNAVTLRDGNRPKIKKNLVCWGGGGVTVRVPGGVTVRVPVAFRNKCEHVTGPQPERVRSIFAGVNATRTTGTGPEREPEQVWTRPLSYFEIVYPKPPPLRWMGVRGETWIGFIGSSWKFPDFSKHFDP